MEAMFSGSETVGLSNNQFSLAKIIFDPVQKKLASIFDEMNLSQGGADSWMGFDDEQAGFATPAVLDDEIWAVPLGTELESAAVIGSWVESIDNERYLDMVPTYDVAEVEESHLRAAAKYGW